MKHKELLLLPNLLSLSRVPFGLAFAFLFMIVQHGTNTPINNAILYGINFIIFLLAIISDGLDGYYARKMNIVTDLGKHLDPLTDSFFFILVFFAFTYIALMHPILFAIVFIREFIMHAILRPYVKRKGTSLPASIYGKLKTFAQCILSMIILGLLFIKEVFIVYSKDVSKLDNITIILSHIFFSIIALLSVISFALYLISLKKTFSKS